MLVALSLLAATQSSGSYSSDAEGFIIPRLDFLCKTKMPDAPFVFLAMEANARGNWIAVRPLSDDKWPTHEIAITGGMRTTGMKDTPEGTSLGFVSVENPDSRGNGYRIEFALLPRAGSPLRATLAVTGRGEDMTAQCTAAPPPPPPPSKP